MHAGTACAATRPGRRRWIAALVVSLTLACTADQRHGVLTTLFDGVPPRGAIAAEPPRVAQFLPPVESAGLPPFEREEHFLSVHRPYAEGVCGECHDLSQQAQTLLTDQVQCLRCHGDQAVAEAWDHGPAALGECSVCHDAHVSAQTHLQRIPQPALCAMCHVEPDLMARVPAHLAAADTRCTACHDPHRHLLRADAGP